MKKWIKDIREKTKDMNREQTIEYICNYYWYHILIGCILLGLVLLLIYHIGWGKKEKEFSCVIVNQEIDFKRDRELSEDFCEFAGLDKKKVSIDSDYQISYADKELEGVNESSYEKFFFNWSSGVIDVMVLPESFYKYCLELGGGFRDLRELVPEDQRDRLEEQRYQENGQAYTGIYVKGTALERWLQMEEEDPLVLVVPIEMKHEEPGGTFLEYVLDASGK